jgi:hypothetical protein
MLLATGETVMKRFFLIAAALLVVSLPAAAQTEPAAAAPDAAAPVTPATAASAPDVAAPVVPAAVTPATSAAPAPKTFSVATSTIGDLLDNPAAKAVFVKYLPDVASDPQINQGRGMTLPEIKSFIPDLTPDKMAAIDADLKALPPQ